MSSAQWYTFDCPQTHILHIKYCIYVTYCTLHITFTNSITCYIYISYYIIYTQSREQVARTSRYHRRSTQSIAPKHTSHITYTLHVFCILYMYIHTYANITCYTYFMLHNTFAVKSISVLHFMLSSSQYAQSIVPRHTHHTYITYTFCIT